MSDLQLGLIFLGAVFVVAVWAYNKTQERRIRRRVEDRFVQGRPDALFADEQNAAKSSIPEAHAQKPTATVERAEPHFTSGNADSGDARQPRSAQFSAQSSTVSASQPESEPVRIDEEIQALLTLTTEQPVSGERVLASLQGLRRAGRQPVVVAAVPASSADDEDGWRSILPGERYETILVAVQLANRSGPINEIEFSEFVAALQYAAEQIPATCEAPDMIVTIARARALDQRCAPLDAQIGINLASPQGAWSGDRIAQVVQERGMVLRSDGRFHAVQDNGVTLYALQNGDGTAFRSDTLAAMTTARVTLLLEVPRAPRALNPYAHMAAAAQVLADKLGAIVVDDHERVLTPAALAAVEKQLEPVYARLEAEQMPAGSPRALALFG